MPAEPGVKIALSVCTQTACYEIVNYTYFLDGVLVDLKQQSNTNSRKKQEESVCRYDDFILQENYPAYFDCFYVSRIIF